MRTKDGNPNDQGNYFGNRQAKIATGTGVTLVGDFARAESVRIQTEKKRARFEFRNTDRFKSDFAICLSGAKKCKKNKIVTYAVIVGRIGQKGHF